jgi:glutamate racemase
VSLSDLPTAVARAIQDVRQPVGVFDSGVGGLTVLTALRTALPHTDFVYVADTARVPYGRKPREMVRGFAGEITRFLVELGVRGVVVACNTASAAALPDLWESSAVPVWGVIDPGVEAARRQTRTGRVGVLGTVGTIRSGVYQQKLEALGLTVWARACPMFVHLVEEGLAGSPEAEILARHYLADMPDIDTLVLGCTHYPVLRPVIQRAAGDNVALVSSADVTAERLAHSFNGQPPTGGRIVHFVTGDTAAYRHTAAFMGGLEGEVVHLDVNELAR